MVSRKIKKDLIRDVFNISIERGMAVQNERINVYSYPLYKSPFDK